MIINPVISSDKTVRKALVLQWGKGPILTNIMESLEKLGYEVLSLGRSGNDVATILQLIEEHRPEVCFTRQRLYANLSKVSEALKRNKCRQLIVDLGVWPHYGSYIMDRHGDNATSSLVSQLTNLDGDSQIRIKADRFARPVLNMRRTLQGRAAAEANDGLAERLGIPGHFTLLILQREGDQVLNVDAPRQWRNQKTLAQLAVMEATRQDRFVVIKAHPQSRINLDVADRGPHHSLMFGVRFGANNDAHLAWLMTNATNAIMVNSTCHFQTLALGLPTACLGRGWFTGNQVVTETDQISEAFANKSIDTERSERYLRHLMSRQLTVSEYGEPNKLEALMHWLEQCEQVYAPPVS